MAKKGELFKSVQMPKLQLNSFDLTHDVKLSCNMGQLVPICCIESVPGDKFKIGCEALIRFQPMVAPVMHRYNVTMHYFFVPHRLVWDNWENFITQTEVAGSIPAFPTMIIAADGVNYTKLMDYLQIPDPALNVGAVQDEVVSALPFAAYQLIWNEFYRDQNLQTEIAFALDDGDNTPNAALRQIRNRAWEHDYFTSALPFVQKGAAVDLPIGDVSLKNPLDPLDTQVVRDLAGDPLLGSLEGGAGGVLTNSVQTAFLDPNGTLIVDAGTINDFRRAVALQQWFEKNARGGTRYIEHIRAHFGVVSSDKRLQRPEYITGVKSPIMISEVLQTSGTVDGETAQGTMAGHGVGVSDGSYGYYFAEEHGYVIGLMSVMPKTAYQQGIPKHFLKTSDAFQYYYGDFAHLGEQPIDNRELFAFTADGDDPFGYIPRYSEYKFEPNRVAGDFRSSLDYWTGSRIFSSQPSLNSAFIECDSLETDRIFAVTDPEVDKVLCQVLNKIKAVRKMPVFGTPAQIV